MNQKVFSEINKFYGKPSALLFTDRVKIKNLEELLPKLPKNSAVILREYDLDEKDRKNFAQAVSRILKRKRMLLRPKILVGKDLLLAQKIKADGVHFSDKNLQQFSSQKAAQLKRRLPKNFMISCSCHSAKSAKKALVSKLDLIVISPIFNTTSHFETKAFGVRNLAKISVNSRISGKKIYALGGINSDNIKQIRKLGIAGFGAIDLFKEHL